jgi:hypothetical protein
MLALLHYLPHVLFTGLAFLALAVMIGEASTGRRSHSQRLPRQHYTWNDHNPRRD